MNIEELKAKWGLQRVNFTLGDDPNVTEEDVATQIDAALSEITEKAERGETKPFVDF